MKRKQSQTVRAFTTKFLAIFVFVMVFLMAFVTVREIFNKSKLDKEVLALNAEIEQLKLKQDGLMSLIDSYQDDFYLEQEARSKMNLKKPGESVVVVKLDSLNNLSHTTGSGQHDPTGALDKRTNVIKWWDYFFATRL